MNQARFLAAARLEHLAGVAYYSEIEPGLGLRFTAAVEEATSRALAFPLAGSPFGPGTRRVLLKDFHSPSFIDLRATVSWSSPSPHKPRGRGTGVHACVPANCAAADAPNSGVPLLLAAELVPSGHRR